MNSKLHCCKIAAECTWLAMCAFTKDSYMPFQKYICTNTNFHRKLLLQRRVSLSLHRENFHFPSSKKKCKFLSKRAKWMLPLK